MSKRVTSSKSNKILLNHPVRSEQDIHIAGKICCGYILLNGQKTGTNVSHFLVNIA